MAVPWCTHVCPPILDINHVATTVSLVRLIKNTKSPFETAHPEQHLVQLNIIPYYFETNLFEPIVIILMSKPHQTYQLILAQSHLFFSS
jgi:hypothetical protein